MVTYALWLTIVLVMITLGSSFGLHGGPLKAWKGFSLAALPTALRALERDGLVSDLHLEVSNAFKKIDFGEERREKFSSLRKDAKLVLKSFVKNAKDSTNRSFGKELLWSQVAIYSLFATGAPAILNVLTKLGAVGAFGGGLYVTAQSMLDLKEQNSFFLAPAHNHHLKTSGMYKYVRHPMYAGIIATCLGSAVLSESPEKLLLTAALAFVLVSTPGTVPRIRMFCFFYRLIFVHST